MPVQGGLILRHAVVYIDQRGVAFHELQRRHRDLPVHSKGLPVLAGVVHERVVHIEVVARGLWREGPLRHRRAKRTKALRVLGEGAFSHTHDEQCDNDPAVHFAIVSFTLPQVIIMLP